MDSNLHKAGTQLLWFSMVFVALFFIYVTFIHPHETADVVERLRLKAAATAKNQPEKVETKQEVASAEPWVPNPDVVSKGEALYQANCAMCHGTSGTGDGVAGLNLNPRPRDLIEGEWKQGGTPFAMFNTLTKGIPGTSMAPYAHMSASDRWALVHYVRSITKNAPEATAEEIEKFKSSGN